MSDQTPLRITGWLRVVAVTSVVLVAGFGDGLGFALASRMAQRSPWEFLLPILLLPLAAYLTVRRKSAVHREDLILLGAFAAFSAVVLLVEYAFVGDFYLLGLVQLLVISFVVVLIHGIFASAPTWLDIAFRRSLVVIHYFLCAYAVVAYFVWHLWSWDSSLRVVLSGAGPPSVGYYGFRPSGFSAEPQWAAIAVAASYVGVHYLAPRHRLNAFLALLVGVEAVQSGTGYLFVAFVVLSHAPEVLRALWQRVRTLPARQSLGASRIAGGARSRSDWLLTGLLVVLGLFVASFGIARPLAAAEPSPNPSPSVSTQPSAAPTPTPRPSTDIAQPPLERAGNIVGGQDPSTSMRLTSAFVALRVTKNSFPIGVGYGNFRNYAIYPVAFAALLADPAQLSTYKSDFFALNYIAELGVLGAILVLFICGLLIRTGDRLVIAFVVLILGVSGTILLPPVLAMAAVAGLLKRDARLTETTSRTQLTSQELAVAVPDRREQVS